MEEELFKAMRHSTLEAIDKGEKLLKALIGKTGKASNVVRESTERIVQKLKKNSSDTKRNTRKPKPTNVAPGNSFPLPEASIRPGCGMNAAICALATSRR